MNSALCYTIPVNYLFLDIECSEGKSICSFGYVLADALFNVLEKKDILINPQSYFHTGPWKKKDKEENEDEGIKLAYPVSEFRSKENFPCFYDEIKKIVTAKGRKVVGFSICNDARFINYACCRYHMPCFNFPFIDVQRVCQDLFDEKNQIALEKMIAEYDVDIDGLTPHKSSDDAHITMLVTEAICKREGKTIEQLAEEHPRAFGEARKHMPKKKKQRPANKQKAENKPVENNKATSHKHKKYYHHKKRPKTVTE